MQLLIGLRYDVTATSLAASSGTPTAGGRYNWATTAGSDRAIGFMTDAAYTSSNSIMAYYRNTSGGYISSLTISFNVERYVVNTATCSVAFYTSTDGTNWTAQTAGDIATSVFTPGSVAYLFNAPTTVAKTVTLSNLALANAADIYLRWVFTNTGNTNSQGLGLDDVTVTANTASPTLSANLGDHLTDANANGIANPGETITYRDTIKNSGTGAATGVTIAQSASGTTFTNGTIKTSALARDDNYSTGANPASLTVSTTAAGLLNNDYGLPSVAVVSFGPTANGSATIAGSAGTTNNGGSLTVNANGTFAYTPAAGFTGIDQFKYIAGTGVGLPNNDAIVSIMVGTPATATADAYAVTGNVSITMNGATGVLSNDAGTGTKTVTSVNGSASNVGVNVTTARGGTVNVSASGAFTYNPPAGYEGTDEFGYSVDNGFQQPSSGVVTLTINGMIWFVNNNATTSGDGRLSSPFKLLSDFTGASLANNPAANDNIFLYESTTPYSGALTLLGGQKLIGQDATTDLATLTGITLAPGSTTLPTMNTSGNATTITSSATTVTLGTGNFLYGLTLGNSFSSHLVGSAFGTLTVKDVTISGTGQAINLNNGAFAANSTFTSVASTTSGSQGVILSGITGSAAFGSTTISGAATQGILVGTTTADINFGNTSVAANSDGVSLQNNSSGTRTFGTLNITVPGANVGFLHAVGGGAVVAGNSTINNSSSGTGTGVDINAPNANVSFGTVTVNKNGAAAAVNLTNTSSTTANITFSGVAAGTSGTRLTGTGINITGGGTNTSTYSFGVVSIYTTGVTAFNATNVDGTINSTSGIIDVLTATAINIAGPAGFTTLGMTLSNVNSTGGTNNISLVNTSGSANLGNGALSAATATAFNIDGGNATTSYAGSITKTTAGRLINIINRTGNNVTLSGNLSSTASSTGINVSGSTSGGTIDFSGSSKVFNTGTSNPINLATNGTTNVNFSNGGLAITTSTATGFNASGGGIINVTGTGNTITSTGGTAINIQNTTIGSSNLIFQSVSTNGGSNGIYLSNTGTSGGLQVTGDNTNWGSGGTIANTTGADGVSAGNGIYLNSTSNVSLSFMKLNDHQNNAVFGTGVRGFALSKTRFTGNSGTSNSGTYDESPVHLVDIGGAVSIKNSYFSGAAYNSIH